MVTQNDQQHRGPEHSVDTNPVALERLSCCEMAKVGREATSQPRIPGAFPIRTIETNNPFQMKKSKLPFLNRLRRQRRNAKKAIKRKLRRYETALWGSLPVSHAALASIWSLTPEQAGALYFGSIRERRRGVLAIKASCMALEHGEPQSLSVDAGVLKHLVPPTQEFVKKGTRWGLKRREVFRLW